MTKEEKQLLLVDLCTRLPYGVKAWEDDEYPPFTIIGYDGTDFIDNDGWEHRIGGFKPHLRPMSSMTDEEKEELKNISARYIDEWENAKTAEEKWELGAKTSYMNAVFYNSHHLDWNGLIDKGLALEAPDGMYNKKGE